MTIINFKIKIKTLFYNIILFLLVFLNSTTAFSDKTVTIFKAQSKIIIDGYLNEPDWNSTGYSEFVQRDPIDGEKPTEKTTVWVTYDDSFLYIAARMYDKNPESIIKRLEPFDNVSDTDWFTFSIDPYLDKRTGFYFKVSAAGCKSDAILINDGWKDFKWDGVWFTAAKIDDKGWTVEIKVPFNQLRFSGNNTIWGVNFARFIQRKNEYSTYVWIPKEKSGYVSHFAPMKHIRGIKKDIYFKLLPYAVGKIKIAPKENNNPFETGFESDANVGLDLKLGLTSSMTLDLTINPDFGQVEVDPAVVNLSAYETYFDEKRPFFIEGSSIFSFGNGGAQSNWNFNWGSPTLFYSRRIGKSPDLEVDTDGNVDYPERTTILSAAKLTGKIGKSWNTGILTALTAEEFAEIDNEGKRLKEKIEPFSNYSVIRTQRDFNSGKQGLGFILTNVYRNLNSKFLRDNFIKNAIVTGFDAWINIDKEGTWILTGWVAGSQIQGSKEIITDTQQSVMHYFQRPDASHLKLNTEKTTLSGWSSRVAINKQKGKFFLNSAVGAISPGFENSDLGYRWDGDSINGHFVAGYNESDPKSFYNKWSFWCGAARNYDFGYNLTSNSFLCRKYILYKNYWSTNFGLSYHPDYYSKGLTRGGPLAKIQTRKSTSFDISTDIRKFFSTSTGFYLSSAEHGDFYYNGYLSLTLKPKSNIKLSLYNSYSKEHDVGAWIDSFEDNQGLTEYNKRYVFAKLDRYTYSSSIRLNWTFSPKTSLQIYLQPYISAGHYKDFQEFIKSKQLNFNKYNSNDVKYSDETYTIDPDGNGPSESFTFDNPDFNEKSLRGTMVFRWDFSPGSTLYFVWEQNRSDSDNPGSFMFDRDFADMVKSEGEDILLLKITYNI